MVAGNGWVMCSWQSVWKMEVTLREVLLVRVSKELHADGHHREPVWSTRVFVFIDSRLHHARKDDVGLFVHAFWRLCDAMKDALLPWRCKGG